MSREYLVTSVPAHAEAIRINNTMDQTLNDPASYRKKISNEINLISDRLALLQRIMKAKGMSEKCIEFPTQFPSLNWNYKFTSFFSTQFRTIERILSLQNLNIPLQDIELELTEAVYQQEILCAALDDLHEAIEWFSAYEKRTQH